MTTRSVLAGALVPDVPSAFERWGLGLHLAETTVFLGSTARAAGRVTLRAAPDRSPRVVARYVVGATAPSS